jgi:cytochrome P450
MFICMLRKSYLWQFGSEVWIAIAKPDPYKQALTKKNLFARSELKKRTMKQVTGANGLLTTCEEEWALHRQIVHLAFHQENLRVQHYKDL